VLQALSAVQKMSKWVPRSALARFGAALSDEGL
jgi:NADH:ubiquinone oxidoreductase subunit E